MLEKQLKVGVWRGGGPPPGYKFTVLIPDLVYNEARRFLNAAQYEHASHLVRDLAEEDDPTHSVRQQVDAIENYHELKDKGGVLGKINLRIFFYVHRQDDSQAIVVLGAINKSAEGQTPTAVRIHMRQRLRKYLNGEWQLPN